MDCQEHLSLSNISEMACMGHDLSDVEWTTHVMESGHAHTEPALDAIAEEMQRITSIHPEPEYA